MILTIDDQRCIQCGTCVGECPRKALSLTDGKVVYEARKCFVCGHCLAVCPRDAILIDGAGYDCEDVEDLGYAQIPNKFQLRNMILARRSVRRFTDDPVTDEELEFILEAGKYSPTGMNRQGNAFLVIKNEKVAELTADTIELYRAMAQDESLSEKEARLFGSIVKQYDESGTDGLYFNAPLVIIVFGDTDVDGAIAATFMGSMAQTQQLGYCFARIPIHAFSDEAFAAKWQAPEGKKAVIALIIGNSEPEYFSSVPRRDPKTTVIG